MIGNAISPMFRRGVLGGSSYDADAVAYFTRVTAVGDSLTVAQKNAWNTFVKSAKANGYYSKLKQVLPMIGSNAAGFAVNAISSSYTASFSSGWTFASTGATSNGTSAYLDTGFDASTQLTSSNAHMMLVSRTASQLPIGKYDSGVSLADANYFGIICYYGTGLAYFGLGTTTYACNVSVLTGAARYIANRHSATVTKGYINGVEVASATDSATPTSGNVYLGAENRSGVAANFSGREYDFLSFGDSLTPTEAALYDADVLTFNNALGR